jgi:hypothetical protein
MDSSDDYGVYSRIMVRSNTELLFQVSFKHNANSTEFAVLGRRSALFE